MKFKAIALVLLASVGCATAQESRLAGPDPFDVLIRHGTVYNGSDEPFVGDVALNGDRIAAIGRDLGHLRSRRTIEARGMIVAPGFIDPHAHLGEPLQSDDPQTRLIPG